MEQLNIKNELVKRRYFRYLEQAEGLADRTITGIEQAIYFFERFIGFKDFRNFTTEEVRRFKAALHSREYRGKKISLNTYKTYLKYLKKFYLWLSQQPGYKSKIKPDAIEYFNIKRKKKRMASILQKVEFPSPEYCTKLINAIEINSEVARRDRALITFTFLTGMRDRAIVSLPLNCIDVDRLLVMQNPVKGVETKFTKYILSAILKIDQRFVDIVLDWINYLKSKGFSPDDPLFPRSVNNQSNGILSFQKPTEIEPVFWQTTESIREIFKQRSREAGLKYFPPRAIRHTTVYHAIRNAKDGAQLKALSQHFGHNDISTTLQIYGNFDEETLADVLTEIDFSGKSKSPIETLTLELKELKEQLKKQLIQNDEKDIKKE